MAAPWAMATMVNAPRGIYDASNLVLGQLRKDLAKPAPRPATAPFCRSHASMQDLGLVVSPDYKELQRWWSANGVGSSRPASAAPSALHLHHSASHMNEMQSKTRRRAQPPIADECVLRHLRGARPADASQSPIVTVSHRERAAISNIHGRSNDSLVRTTSRASFRWPKHGEMQQPTRTTGTLPSVHVYSAHMDARGRRCHPSFAKLVL